MEHTSTTQEDSKFVRHEPCGSCGSSDANSLYDDGHQWCFSCQTFVPGDGSAPSGPAPNKVNSQLLRGDYNELRSRQLSEETCRRFGYMVTKGNDGQPIQVATYKDLRGNAVAQKIRTRDKKFSVLGDKSKMGLFGMQLVGKGKAVYVCEGELDAMSLSQIMNHKASCVSVPHGAQSAKRHLLENIDYLTKFDSIVLCFDDDKSGQEAAQSCAEVLPVGKVKIASMPHGYKDANECLVAGCVGPLITAVREAAAYRPDGIVAMTDLREVVAVQDAESHLKYPYPKLNKMLGGLRQGLITICAGSGVGKSTLMREFAYSLQQSGNSVGMLMLEESTKRTAQGLVGLHIGKNITVDDQAATPDEIVAGFDDLMSSGNPIYLLDHFGSSDLETICSRIRYMKHQLGCEVIILDHVSILISSYAGSADGNERVLIDHIMHTMRVLCSEIDISLLLVSHLRRPSGDKGHEGGASVNLSQLRGSHSLAQLADGCIALQIPEDDPTSGARELVVLKNRHSGRVGPADDLKYDHDTSRLLAVSDADIPF